MNGSPTWPTANPDAPTVIPARGARRHGPESRVNPPWPTVPLLDALADITGGNRKIPKIDYQANGELAVVDQGNGLVAGFVDDASAAVGAAPPTIVFGDHTRVFKFVDFPFAMGADGIKVLKTREGIYPKFAFHFLQSATLPNAGYSRHFKFLKEVQFPLPPLGVQRRIAEILDAADAVRAARQAALVRLDELPQAIFHQMFACQNWPMSTLNELSTITGQYGANVPSIEWAEGLPRYIRITDIDDGGRLTDDARAPGGDAELWSNYHISAGDLLFARSGATVGKTYLHRDSQPNAVFAGYLIRFRLDTSIALPEFISAFTRSPRYLTWVAARQNVVAQPNINAKQYGNELPVPVPPLELQREFAAKVEAAERTRAVVVDALKADNELFAALQIQSFADGAA